MYHRWIIDGASIDHRYVRYIIDRSSMDHRWIIDSSTIGKFYLVVRRPMLIFGFFQKIGFLMYLGAPGALGWF